MPRTASTNGRKSARTAPPVRRPAKKMASASGKNAAKANGPAKPNGNGRVAAKASRDHRQPTRAASEKVVQGGRSSTVDAAASSASRGKYVYCIIDSSDPLRFGPVGIGAEPSEVYTVHYKNLAAVVSDAPLEVLDSTRENVLAHERVNETVMREHTVIPMSFGTIFKTREDIVELLRSAYDAFLDVLSKMQDKLEFGLKVLWESQEIVRVIEQEEEDIRRLKTELSSQKGSTYFARVQYDRLVAAALEARSERFVKSIMDELSDVSVASRWNKPIGDKMILNAAFLVPRDKEGVFDAKMKEIGVRYSKLNFRYTGPWPPYNFVNIRLKLERAKDAK